MGKKIGIGLLILLGLFILLMVFAPAPEDGDAPTTSKEHTMKTYTQDTEKFELSYPSSWSVIEKPVTGALVMFQSPSQGADDTFGENVNVLMQDVSASGMTLKDYHDLSVEQVEAGMGSDSIKEDSMVKVSGMDAYRLEYQGVYPNQDVEIKFLQLFTMKEGKVYIFTYSAEPSEYATFIDDVEALFASITFN